MAIETYERILGLVPDHKEALDSIYFLKGRPKDLPLRDDAHGAIPGLYSDKTWQSKEKLKFMLDDEKGEKEDDIGRRESREKKERKKKRRKRRSTSTSSSDSSSSYSDDSGGRRRKRKSKKDKRGGGRKSRSRSLSPFSLRGGQENMDSREGRAMSPFSQKMFPSQSQRFPGQGDPPMNMPPGYYKQAAGNNPSQEGGGMNPTSERTMDMARSQR